MRIIKTERDPSLKMGAQIEADFKAQAGLNYASGEFLSR